MVVKKKTAKKKTRKPKKALGTCFVLTPFGEPFDIHYERIIEPAIVKAKLEPE